MPRVGERRLGLTERIHLWVLAARWDPGSVYKSSSGSDLPTVRTTPDATVLKNKKAAVTQSGITLSLHTHSSCRSFGASAQATSGWYYSVRVLYGYNVQELPFKKCTRVSWGFIL